MTYFLLLQSQNILFTPVPIAIAKKKTLLITIEIFFFFPKSLSRHDPQSKNTLFSTAECFINKKHANIVYFCNKGNTRHRLGDFKPSFNFGLMLCTKIALDMAPENSWYLRLKSLFRQKNIFNKAETCRFLHN